MKTFLKNLFGGSSHGETTRQPDNRAQLGVENLGERVMMSVTTTFDPTTIHISADPGSTLARVRVTEGVAFNRATGRFAEAVMVTDLDTSLTTTIFRSSLSSLPTLRVDATTPSCTHLEFDNQTGLASTVFGSQGNDVIRGGSRGDLIFGNNGDDIIEGRVGDDSLFGGAGSDTYVFGGRSLGNDSITDDSADRNKLDFSTALSGVKVDLGTTNRQNVIVDGQFLDLSLQFNGSTVISDVVGSRFNDEIRGNKLDNFLEGGDGEDLIKGFEGFDTLHGGTGNDTLGGGDGDDQLYGGDGADNLNGENGNDVLNGGKPGAFRDGATDTLRGGAGTDYFYTEYNWVWKGWYWQRNDVDSTSDFNRLIDWDYGNW